MTCSEIRAINHRIHSGRRKTAAAIASTNKTSKTPNRPFPNDEGLGGAGSSFCSSSRRACCSASSIASNRASRSLASYNCACSSSSRVSGGARPPAASCNNATPSPSWVACSGPNARSNSDRSMQRPPAASVVVDKRPDLMARCRVVLLTPAARAAALMLNVVMLHPPCCKV